MRVPRWLLLELLPTEFVELNMKLKQPDKQLFTDSRLLPLKIKHR